MNLQFLRIGTRFDMVAALEVSWPYLLIFFFLSLVLLFKKTKQKTKKRTPDINWKEKK